MASEDPARSLERVRELRPVAPAVSHRLEPLEIESTDAPPFDGKPDRTPVSGIELRDLDRQAIDGESTAIERERLARQNAAPPSGESAQQLPGLRLGEIPSDRKVSRTDLRDRHAPRRGQLRQRSEEMPGGFRERARRREGLVEPEEVAKRPLLVASGAPEKLAGIAVLENQEVDIRQAPQRLELGK